MLTLFQMTVYYHSLIIAMQTSYKCADLWILICISFIIIFTTLNNWSGYRTSTSLRIIEGFSSTGIILLNITHKKCPEHLVIPDALSYQKKAFKSYKSIVETMVISIHLQKSLVPVCMPVFKQWSCFPIPLPLFET